MQFDKLMEAYQNDILRLCYGMLNNITDAEDALQDTFVKVWKSMHRYQGKNSSSLNWPCLRFSRGFLPRDHQAEIPAQVPPEIPRQILTIGIFVTLYYYYSGYCKVYNIPINCAPIDIKSFIPVAGYATTIFLWFLYYIIEVREDRLLKRNRFNPLRIMYGVLESVSKSIPIRIMQEVYGYRPNGQKPRSGQRVCHSG